MQGKGLLLLGLVAFSCMVDIAIACCKHRGDFYCCGNGPCNVFCCNCDNGCNPSCETDFDGIFNKGVAVAGLVAAGAAVGRRKRSIDHDSYLQDMAYRSYKHDLIDTNHDDLIDFNEMVAYAKLVNVTLPHAQLIAEFNKMDRNKNFVIEIEEFDRGLASFRRRK